MSLTVGTLAKMCRDKLQTTYKVNKYILLNYIYCSTFLPNIIEIGPNLNFVFNFLSYFDNDKEETGWH